MKIFDGEDSYIVNLWAKVFEVLGMLSIFCIIKKVKKEKVTAKFVDTWVLGNLLASFLFSWLAFILESEPIIIFLIIYSLARVFEIIIS
ncbi:hypothetical protein HZY86_07685 [Aerococcaceae bacterium DSM 111020]|nr:hypothetical protein [Aerococcaceae bacterium DSM 111020]